MNGKNRNWAKQRLPIFVLLIGFALLGCVSGCATTKPADFLAPGFDGASVDDVAVLPVLDHRIDQTKTLKLDKWVWSQEKRWLKKKRYAYTVYEDRSLISHISRDALEASTPDFIASLPPDSARWVLLVVLEDSTSKMVVLGSTGSAEVSGYLFDKEQKQLCWRDKEVHQLGQGGLIGMALKGAWEKDCITIASEKMFKTLPSRPK